MEIIQARSLTVFGHITRMDDIVDAKQIYDFLAFCVLEDHQDDRG